MGSLIAPFDEKGNLQTQTTSGDSLKNKSGKNKNTVDSDMFLTLLVAEMQNQDPLEPTSNTEWVSQYATFTQVQQMSEMAESIDVLRANNLIGKEVIMRTTSESTGDVNYIQGIVDFVEVENGKPLLVIDDKKYSISDLDTIVSSQYSAAYEKYSTFKEMIDALPDVAFANRTYENVVQGALDFYNTMDDYQKNYMKIYGSEQMEKFTEWKLELENMGIKFKDTSVEEEEEKTSLDDILESFNTKMNAIIEKLNLLSENKTDTDQSGTTNKPETDGDQSGTANKPETDADQSGTVNKPETDGDQSGTANKPETDGDQSGTVNKPETDADQSGTVNKPETDGDQSGTVNKPDTDQSGTTNKPETDTDQSGTVNKPETDTDQSGSENNSGEVTGDKTEENKPDVADKTEEGTNDQTEETENA